MNLKNIPFQFNKTNNNNGNFAEILTEIQLLVTYIKLS